MPKYTINGKTYSSPTPLSEDDLLELSQGAPSAAPTAAPRDEPSTLSKIGKTADDLVRAAANGLTFGWADRLAARGDAALGKGDYTSNVQQERQLSSEAQQRNPYVYKGVELGSSFLVPGVGLVKGASTGAKVLNAAGNGALYGALSGSGEASGDTDPIKAAMNTGTGAALGATIGTVATPLVNKGLEMASRFSPKVDNALTQGAVARTYKDNPNAIVDAEITRDLGLMAGGKDKGLQAIELNDLAKSYINQAKKASEKAGILGDTEKLSIENYRSLLARPEDIAKLQETKGGQAILDILNKAKRTSELTQAAEANNGVIPKLARTTVDSGILDALIMGSTGIPVPIATAARQGIKKALGANSTRAEVAAGLTTDRGLKAANKFLETSGPSDATKGLGILQKIGADQDAAKAAEALLAKQQAEASAGALKEANIAGMRMNRAPAGGAFQSLKQYTGLADDEIVDALRSLSNHPTLGKYADQIRKGGNTDDGTLYAVQNAINGIQKRQGGILNQAEPGALYKGNNVSVGSPSPVSNAIYNLPDDQVAQLLGREADTLGKNIGNARGYLTTRASRALETMQKSPDAVPEADKALLKALGLI